MAIELATNLGRRVAVTVDQAGRRVVHKQLVGAEHQGSSELVDMVEQWRHVEAATGLNLYPSVYDVDPTEVTLEHYDRLSLDHCRDLGEVEAVTRRSVAQLVLAATRTRTVDTGIGSSAFMTDELAVRLRRLRSVEAQLPAPIRPIVGDCVRYQACTGLERLRDSVVPLSIHGDLGLNNIVHDTDGRIAFIDTRARWTASGIPVWDIALDLATLFIFTAEIQPVLASHGFGRASPLHQHPERLLDIIDDAVRTSGWDALDPDWRQRFSIGCAVRLIGSIGVNLLSARHATAERVEGVVALTIAFLRQSRRRPNAMPPWD